MHEKSAFVVIKIPSHVETAHNIVLYFMCKYVGSVKCVESSDLVENVGRERQRSFA